MAMSIRGNLNIFQQSIQYKYRDTALLKRALTHSSYANEHHMDRHDNNERLEFLGDAVYQELAGDTWVERPKKLRMLMEQLEPMGFQLCQPAHQKAMTKTELFSWFQRRLQKTETMSEIADANA